MQTTPGNEAGIVIIGGGQAGGWAAKTLRDKGYQGTLTVISDEIHDFYERPPLSKSALLNESGELQLSRLFSPEALEKLAINWRRPLRAEQILPEKKQVLLTNGEYLHYDQLLIATGGSPRFPDSKWSQHPHVMALRSWDDALALRQKLRRSKRLAIVGGGWIGLEIAASARQLGLEVTLFERQPSLCMRSIGQEVAQKLLQIHQQQGIHVLCGCGDIQLSSDENDLPVLQSGISAPQSFDLVVVGIGVELNLSLARQAGLKVEAGIVVDEYGRTSHPAIFASGDVAQHPQLGICIQSWAYAQNQAIVAASNMLTPEVEQYNEPAWLWSDQYSHNIQILGIPSSETYCVERQDGDAHLFFYLNANHQLVQMVAFNDGRAVKLGKRWLSAGKVLDPALLADPTVPLMSMK